MIDDENVRLRAVDAAKYLGISRSTLSKWRMARHGPPHHRLGPSSFITANMTWMRGWRPAIARRDRQQLS